MLTIRGRFVMRSLPSPRVAEAFTGSRKSSLVMQNAMRRKAIIAKRNRQAFHHIYRLLIYKDIF